MCHCWKAFSVSQDAYTYQNFKLLVIHAGNAICVEKKPLKLSILFRELMPLASKWQNLGALLDISEEKLDAIKRNNLNQVEDCLRDMISTWLKIDPQPTWKGVVEAVEVIDQKKAEDIKCKRLE